MEDIQPKCSCCSCKAKYEIAGDKVCGRHLAYVVEMHLGMSSDITVCRIENLEGGE